ncbi:hypothetical protein [Actinoplanes utahensis]|uniref:DUF3618 domain-containing protein n=1 Tax=Actinoplanes utahensis TaxID=1869 RepID=A0A0A6UI80_ACTUT|nr:hypothetical protein [Actinoplanes utahensis]KHD74029.1 hypothetical protein MB27_31205 [Actinoplanes utahensis]GIF35249.1 hypothetical protein Aut01nite_82350 [Actinoplanes utahensis]
MSNATGGATAAKARQVAGQGKEAAQQAAADVAGTAAEQAQRVGAEARDQVRTITAEVRDKVGEQARAQSDKLISTIRETADHLDEMRGDRQDSPAATVVARVADGGRQFADYLDRHGPEGVLQEVQDFARRRPGAFLATALAAGFVVGRLGKSVANAEAHAGSPVPEAAAPRPVHTPAAVRATFPAPEAGHAANGAGTASVLDEFTRLQHREPRP